MTATFELDLSNKKIKAWFGGSFDPIHNGHLLAAQELVTQLNLDQLNFTPCYISPLKQQAACSTQDRVNMLRLATDQSEHFALDLREVKREGTSYTVDTLKELRGELGDDVCLLWVVGWDAFLDLPNWHQWQELGELCNIVVIDRPGFSQKLPESLQQWAAGRQVVKDELYRFNFGKLLYLNTPLIEISSRDIRARIQRNLPVQFMLPEKVERYIVENALFLKNIE